ncbi:metalloregulator ArsR/SmtB family transcription factor [Chryseobacterium sp. ERMR1:04]|uniref:helix-turn-helix transcriptional regulator n=1 Tax=Chryseobacterium sp. ERMR1:04 TaxID=1705393 RepID=UPI0006C8E135|nr:metalloregulator ArsR/SmtB family transcription factor [Chryseobacterium sp. ERMR1:04]KPH13005.1 transcriptional regulator [Chryseobacterium sp. ERMR1:04]
MKKNPSDKILMLLKMRGEVTSQLIAEELGITKEGVRKRLLNFASEGLVKAEVKSEGVGRPSTYYALTEKGFSKFPDTHAEVSVQLIKSVKKLLGENALDLLINDRENELYTKYAQMMDTATTFEEKLDILVQKRTEEGYMAEWKKENDSYFLIENHCPICAAATECQGFCRSELNNFKQLIGSDFDIKRVEYIIEGGKRCMYKIDQIIQPVIS